MQAARFMEVLMEDKLITLDAIQQRITPLWDVVGEMCLRIMRLAGLEPLLLVRAPILVMVVEGCIEELTPLLTVSNCCLS